MWPRIVNASPHQIVQAADATTGRVGVLIGGPGTGKTYTAACLVKQVIAKAGKEAIAVAAPTGKAAVRISEVMGEHGVSLQARTIHATLKVEGKEDDFGWGWRFFYDYQNHLPQKYILIDEASMVGTDLLAALISAKRPEAHLLFVGDVNQLPPVDHGAPLRDMVLAGLPCGELRVIRRNSGRIVETCDAIRRDAEWSIPLESEMDHREENLGLLQAWKAEAQFDAVTELMQDVAGMGYSAKWDAQVLVPVNRKSPVSRQALNARLQLLLNSKAEKVSGSPFWVNDKVINQRNSWLPFQSHDADALVNKYNEVYVANGEIGSVVSCEPKRFTVQLESPRREVIVPRGDSDNGQTGCDWDLGYAISVHKSQGSEFPFVFVMLDEYPGAAMVYSREWLYTAISRASKSCILIGREELAKAMCRRVIHNERKTFLCELIKERLNYGKAQEEISAGRATAYQGDGATSREWH